MSRQDIPRLAVGRWKQILSSLGIESKYLRKRQGPCPICGGKDRFRYDNKEERGTFYCNQCGAGDGFRLLELRHGWDFKMTVNEVSKIVGNSTPIPPKPAPDKEEIAKEVWLRWGRARTLVAGDPVLDYLKGRGIAPKRWRDIRYEPAGSALEPGGSMLALFRTARGWPCTLHITPILGGKKLFAKDMPLVSGGAVRLMGHKEDVLGIAEGIETALSAYQLTKIPCWAALSAGLLEKWQPPQVKKVVIFGDNDKSYTGQAAAYTLAKRLTCEGFEVVVDIPACGCNDWNDVLKSKRPSLS